MPKCNYCPFLKLLEKRKTPTVVGGTTVETGRLEIECVELEGKGVNWMIPGDCLEGLYELLSAEKAICGHD